MSLLVGELPIDSGREPLIERQIGDDAGTDGSLTDFNDNPIERYSLDPRRFAILAIFCFNNLIGSAIWITFAPIEDAVIANFRHYDSETSSGGISSQQVNWLSMVSMVVYGPGTALCALVVPRYGFRETVIASSVIMAFGCFLRWLSLSFGILDSLTSDENSSSMARYFVLLTGQGLVALGQTIFMNAPARIAASWFQQTTKSVGAINLCSSVGIIFGQAIPPLYVVEETGKHLDQLLAAQGLVMGICAFFTAYWFRYEEPECAPSAAEAARRTERRRQCNDSPSSNDIPDVSSSNIANDLKKLFSNSQYIILMVAFGINYGVNSAVMTLMQPWIASSGFPGDKMAGLCGSLLIGGGVIGTWIASVLLDITRNYNQAIRWSFISTSIVAIGLVATLQPKCPTWILALAFIITGMTQLPLLTICSDAVAAHTYPVSEELSSAGLQMVGQYLGVILVNGMSRLIEPFPDSSDVNQRTGFFAKVNIAYLSLLSVSTVIACFYNSDDLRANVTIREFQNSDTQTTAILGGNINGQDDVSETNNYVRANEI